MESSTIHYDMYFTEYEISLMPENGQQVQFYEPEEKKPAWSGMWEDARYLGLNLLELKV